MPRTRLHPPQPLRLCPHTRGEEPQTNAEDITAELWPGRHPRRALAVAARWRPLSRRHSSSSDAPEIVELERLAFPRGSGDSYGVRIRGYLAAAGHGDYRFFISADDRGALALSTDADPANKIVVAYTPDWTGPEESMTSSRSRHRPACVQAAERYYFEVLYKQADGKDNLFVAWERPGGEREVIGTRYLEPFE
jgi:hypothetical protein